MASFINRSCIKLQTEQSRHLKNDMSCLHVCFPGTEIDSLTKPWLGNGFIIVLDNSNDKTRGSNVLYLHTMIRSKHQTLIALQLKAFNANEVQGKKEIKKKIGFKLRSMYLLLLEFCYWTQNYKYTVIKRNSELSHSKP